MADAKVKLHEAHNIKKEQNLFEIPKQTPSKYKTDKIYLLRIITGSRRLLSATELKIQAQLIGTIKTTKKFTLASVTDKVFQKDGYDDFSIKCDKIGSVIGVCIYVESCSKSCLEWFLSCAVVQAPGDAPCLFPGYKSLIEGDQILLMSSTGLANDLLITSHKHFRKLIKEQISWQRQQYVWKCLPSQPSTLQEVRYDLALDKHSSDGLSELSKIQQLKGDHTSFCSFDEFRSAINSIEFGANKPDILDGGLWIQDREFGRQMLNGTNPSVIKLCVELPSHFPVTDAILQGLLTRSWTLKTEMKEGHVYIIDHTEMLQGLSTLHVCPVPTCLLYITPKGHLLPIAIQLEPKGVIFTPNDNYFDWLIAKMLFRCGDWQVHQLIQNYLLTHSVVEPFSIGLKRNLPLNHPVYRLLVPYLSHSVSNNAKIRKYLLNPGGLFDKVTSIGGRNAESIIGAIKRGYKGFSFHKLAHPTDIELRGVGNESKLPNYHYRDDGMLIWKAISKMVEEILSIFYTNDEDVSGDEYLQAWAKDVCKNGLPTSDGSEIGHGMPPAINTQKELIDIATTIIWISSARHSAINTGQYQIHGFPPNSPGLIRKSLPKGKGTATLQDVLATLPNKDAFYWQLVIMETLSQKGSSQVQRGIIDPISKNFFVEDSVKEVLKAFTTEMDRLEKEMKIRNQTLEMPYTYLMPSNMN